MRFVGRVLLNFGDPPFPRCTRSAAEHWRTEDAPAVLRLLGIEFSPWPLLEGGSPNFRPRCEDLIALQLPRTFRC